MGRIRTIKPEFWEDEVTGSLSREARLMFIASLNLADDEGLLRWSSAYLKSSVFIYDHDISIPQVEVFMKEIEDSGLVFPYCGGKAKQKLAFIVGFRRHQVINRPQPSKLPPPSLQSSEVRYMYGRRDKFKCHLCGYMIQEHPVENDSMNLSIDHIVPVSQGGKDYPSNVKASHQGCNKSRKDKGLDAFTPPLSVRLVNGSGAESLNESVNDSVVEGKGRERKGNKNPAIVEFDAAKVELQPASEFSATDAASLLMIRMKLVGDKMRALARDAIQSAMAEMEFDGLKAGDFIANRWDEYQHANVKFKVGKNKFLESAVFLEKSFSSNKIAAIPSMSPAEKLRRELES